MTEQECLDQTYKLTNNNRKKKEKKVGNVMLLKQHEDTTLQHTENLSQAADSIDSIGLSGIQHTVDSDKDKLLSVSSSFGGGGGNDGDVPPGGNKFSDSNGKEKPMPLLEHLGELRRRLLYCFIVVGVAFLACYGFADILFHYLALPLIKVMPTDTKFIFTDLPEGFFVYLKVAFVTGIFLASPYIFYQVWVFISPGLYEEERRYIIPLSIFSALFFLGGGTFCYFVVFPFVFSFFMSYSTDTILAMPSLREYLAFSLKLLIAFGLIFEMPLFSFFLAKMHIITAAKMREVRKYAILIVFIIAAFLTPPDVLSQILMAIPMLILYEISIFVADTVGKGHEKKHKNQEVKN